MAELDLDRLAARRARRQRRACAPLPRHPSVVRDLSIVVVRRLACGDHSWHHSGGRRDGAPRRSSAIAFFDRYQGKGVADGAVSLSVRLTFQAPDRTLTDAEVQQSFDTILAALVARARRGSAMTSRDR